MTALCGSSKICDSHAECNLSACGHTRSQLKTEQGNRSKASLHPPVSHDTKVTPPELAIITSSAYLCSLMYAVMQSCANSGTINEIQSNTINKQNYYIKGCAKILPLA